jgi:hypothetical protein
MAIGYLTMGRCHTNLNDALDYYYSSQPISYKQEFGIVFKTFVYKSDGTWFTGYQEGPNPIQTLGTAPSNIIGTCNTDDNLYDYASAAALWGFAFAGVFSLWYLSKNLGMIINAVRRW